MRANGPRWFCVAVIELRDATEADLPEILAITNDAIATSEAIWATSPRTLEERRDWMTDRQAKNFPVVVAVEGDAILALPHMGLFVRMRAMRRRSSIPYMFPETPSVAESGVFFSMRWSVMPINPACMC